MGLPAALRSAIVLSLASLLMVAAPSCTLTRVSSESCTKNDDCQKAFGRGYTCGGGGRCVKAPAFARCDQAFPPDFLTRPEVYPNGVLFGMLTVRSRSTHPPREAAVRLAIGQANDAGGLDGRKFGILSCDVGKDAKYDALDESGASIAAATYLRDAMGVPAIIGPMASDPTLAVWNAVKGSGLLMISPSSTSDALTQVDAAVGTDDEPGLLWRTAAPDSLQGASMARYLAEQNPKVTRAAVVFAKGAYGDGLAQTFSKSFADLGGTADLLPFANAGERDSNVLQVASKGVTFMVVIGQVDDAAACLNGTIGNAAFDKINFLFSDTAGNTDFLDKTKSAQGAYARVFGSRPATPTGDVLGLFALSFRSANNGQDPASLTYVAHAYDAAWMLMYSVAWVQGRKVDLTGKNLARGFRRIVSTGPEIAVEPNQFSRIKTALANDQRVNLRGASGTLDFDPVTEETTTGIDIWKAANNKIEVVKTYQ
jgi:branched-chain amino acid transport system substrate-binding protein